MTAWRRLRAWQEAGVWERLNELLLAAGEIEWSRAIADSSHVQAKRGSETGPSPVDRGRRGSKQPKRQASPSASSSQRCRRSRSWRSRRVAALHGAAPERMAAGARRYMGEGLAQGKIVIMPPNEDLDVARQLDETG